MQRDVRFIRPPEVGGAPGYSHAVDVRAGRTVYVAGQVPLDSANGLVGDGDLRAQVQQCLRNVDAVLRAAGGTIRDVVKFTYFVRDGALDLAALRAARNGFIDPAAQPASTLIMVAGLYDERVLVEIEAVAVLSTDAPAGP